MLDDSHAALAVLVGVLDINDLLAAVLLLVVMVLVTRRRDGRDTAADQQKAR
jgi:hypothetical protein